MSFFTNRRQSDNEQAQKDTDDASKAAHIGFDTVLSATTVLDGTLQSEGNIRLDGKFTGKLDITGNVLVGETAIINADIEARNISIAGQVNGNVSGNKVQLLRTGSIHGDIQANSLTTEEGAFIEGNIAMQHTPSTPPSSTPQAATTQPETTPDKSSDSDDSSDDDVQVSEASTSEDD